MRNGQGSIELVQKLTEIGVALSAEKDTAIEGLTQQLDQSEDLTAELEGKLAEAGEQITNLMSQLDTANETIETLRNAPPVQLVIDGVANSVGQ